MNKIRKFTNIFTILILLMQLIPSSVYAITTNGERNLSISPPEIENNVVEKENKKQIIGEIVEKRDKNMKHFLKSDMTYEAVIYPTAVHYKENGKWKDIDNS